MTSFHEMAAIFLCCPYGLPKFSSFISPGKSRDPKIEGVTNLEFWCMMIFCQMAAVLPFFIMANFPFLLTLGKVETQTLGGGTQ